jgi:hypothetical protein
MSKDTRELIKALEKQGFSILHRNKHYVIRSPDGMGQTVIAATGSEPRGRKNALSQLKKIGFKP